MDCLSYSPKSMSDMSVTSNELRMPTPLDHCNDANINSNASTMPIKFDAIANERKDTNAIETKSIQIATKPNDSLAAVLPAASMPITTTPNLGLSNNEAVYVDEFYRKISEYYRGIFSNIDIKDPNISPDILNYYQLIRQFYEQTMAINIQRNTALGLGSLNNDPAKIDQPMLSTTNLVTPPLSVASTLPTSTSQNDVSTIDLTIHKPTTNESMTFNNIKTNNSYQNNININIGAGNGTEATVKERAAHEAMLKMNETNADDIAENKVTISSAGVSINVSSLNANSLKISCKTTPPKKRYSVYNHVDDDVNVAAKPVHTSITTPQNLNRKFEADATMMAPKRVRTTTPSDDGTAVKSNFGNADDARSNALRSDPIKNSPISTNAADSSNPITDIIPITSTYLQLMRSMGFNEDDALKFDNLVSLAFLYIAINKSSSN